MLPEWRKEMQSRRKLEGIDVSHWEGRIDFSEVRRAGIRIVYIKASEGDREVDPDFERNYREAQTAGLKIGFYHYLTARTVEEGREQARHFAGVIREKHYEACPAMDFESFDSYIRWFKSSRLCQFNVDTASDERFSGIAVWVMRSPEVSPSSLDVVIADTWRRAQKRGH